MPALAAASPSGNGSGGFHPTLVGNFDLPVYADNAPGAGKALFVVEREGVIRVSVKGRKLDKPFLNVRDIVKGPSEEYGEEGLGSIAFHPRYRKNGRFYLFFTNENGDNEVAEFRRSKKHKFVAVRKSARRVLVVPHPGSVNHNGGQLQFGPDGLLYVGTGDGGMGGDPPNNAQNRTSLSGKLLRINPIPKKRKTGGKRHYRIPRGNPFVGKVGRDEIYSIGLRNPFRFSFDALNGAIAIGDVGQDCVEEIDYRGRGRAKGANFGWSRFEGSFLYNGARLAPGAIDPVQEYNHPGSPGCPDPPGNFTGISVIAGFVARDPALPAQYGRLLYGDITTNQIRSLIPAEGGAIDDQATGVTLPGSVPYSFGEGFNHKLYAIGGDGPVFRLDPN